MILYLLPIRRRMLEVGIRYLDLTMRGKVLDVGCGAGSWLLEMRGRGWEVFGLDIDPKAVEAARSAGLSVQCGPVQRQGYPSEFFDAVTLNHVIEHVPDPFKTVKECLRILKPGGKLVIITPNGSGLSHRFFKRDWRGLEPPRHLHIFSLESISRSLAYGNSGKSHRETSSGKISPL